jgi:hypothetical protein
VEWKIFYGEGATYSDEDGPPELAPKRNVQTIAVANELVGRRIERGNDFYIMTGHGWRGCDQFGLFDYLIEPGAKVVLFGRSLADDEYREVLDRATRDPDLPEKSAFLPEERRP